MTEEWGPWIEHHGLGLPVREGEYVHAQAADGSEAFGYAYHAINSDGVDVWIWTECRAAHCWHWRVLRYRIRKPKGLQILEAQLREIPDPVPAKMPDEVPA